MNSLRTWKERAMSRPAVWMRRRQLRNRLRAAYARFAEEQPDWAASLFDEHFLMTRLLPPLLCGIHVRRMKPGFIADAWQAQLFPIAPTRSCTRSQLECAAKRYLELLIEASPNPGTLYPEGDTMFALQAEMIAAEMRRDRERKAQRRALVMLAEEQTRRTRTPWRLWSWLGARPWRRAARPVEPGCSQVEIYG